MKSIEVDNNAVQFVKKVGWVEAMRIVSQAPKLDCSYSQDMGMYLDRYAFSSYEVYIEYLKRLVESYELVESYGGIDKAKSDTSFPACFGDNDFFREVTLKKAIADVESCQ